MSIDSLNFLTGKNFEEPKFIKFSSSNSNSIYV